MKTNPYLNVVLEETYEDGEVIFKEGNSGDWVYVVLSGAVEVSKAVDGARFVLSILKSGEVFGELALIGAVKRTATTRAIGRTTVGIIDKGFLDREFNKLSTDFRTVLVAMVDRFINTMDRAREFGTV